MTNIRKEDTYKRNTYVSLCHPLGDSSLSSLDSNTLYIEVEIWKSSVEGITVNVHVFHIP